MSVVSVCSLSICVFVSLLLVSLIFVCLFVCLFDRTRS